MPSSGAVHFPRWAEPLGRRAIRARISATAASWPLLRHLPGDSRRFGPPRRFADSLPEWARETPEVELKMIDPETTWDPPLPQQPCSEIPELFKIVQHHELSATCVAHIPDGRVFGPDATVIAHDDTVFGDLLNSWPATYQYHSVLGRPLLPTAKRVRGRVAVLGALFANGYHHWLIDIMPRLRLLGEELRRVDWFVVPSTLRFERECLQAAGVPLDRLIEPARGLHLVADELVVPSLVPRVAVHTLPYLQSLFDAHRSRERPVRRLYVTRANMWRRRVANERELVAALTPLGFEVVVMDRLSIAEQARLFSEAAVVLGPNGSALANVVFSQPGVRLVELFDSNYLHVGDWQIAVRAGGSYNVMLVPSPPTTSQWRDITVPVDKLLGMLAAHGIA